MVLGSRSGKFKRVASRLCGVQKTEKYFEKCHVAAPSCDGSGHFVGRVYRLAQLVFELPFSGGVSDCFMFHAGSCKNSET